MKKKVSKKRGKKKTSEHFVLSEALTDVSKELIKLRKDKLGLTRKLELFEKEIINVRNYEVKLRDRISKLIAKESTLSKNKGASQTKLLNIKEKIAKIKKVQEELRDV